MKLTVRDPDELIAVLPYRLGFKPENSIVLLALTPDLPDARFDIPTDGPDRREAFQHLQGVYCRYATPGASVGVVCVSKDQAHAQDITSELASTLEERGVQVRMRVWADETHWCDLDSEVSGLQTEIARDRFAAIARLNGHPLPAHNRDELNNSLVGDHAPVAELLVQTRARFAGSTRRTEQRKARNSVHEFLVNGIRLTDTEAARLIVAVGSRVFRDRSLDVMTRRNAAAQVDLWKDMTQRAPDEVRAEPASLLAFACWLKGDGAMAWTALDQIPPDQPNTLAAMVTHLQIAGIHPREWDSARGDATTKAGESRGFMTVRAVDRSSDRPTPGM